MMWPTSIFWWERFLTWYRILATKSIAERRKERDDAERARLDEIQRKTDLRNEFFNIDKKNKLDQVDLVEMGMVGGETVETSSIPENRNVKSQRFNDSASILGNVITETEDLTMTHTGGIPANLESGQLVSGKEKETKISDGNSKALSEKNDKGYINKYFIYWK